MRIYLAIDDTDNLESPGTGKTARELAKAVESAKLGESLGVTRHQLLVDPRIPYTSHNSSACVEFESDVESLYRLIYLASDFLQNNFNEGADPGLCVCRADAKLERIAEFGRRAQREIVAMETAYLFAEDCGAHLSAHGGTGLGVIGALAAVGLRSTGEDGRFLDLKGARKTDGVLTASELFARTGIVKIITTDGKVVGDKALVDTRGWIRPDLIGGEPVLRVERHSGGYRTLKSKEKKGTDDG